MTTTAQRRLQAGFRGRRNQRDRAIRAAGRNFDRATGDIFDRLIGIVATNRGGSDAVMQRVDRIIRAIPADAAAAMEKTLQDVWQWSWLSATNIVVRSVPIDIWFSRTAPLTMQIGDGTTEAVPFGGVGLPGEPPPPELLAGAEWEKILGGKVTREKAIEIIRQLEFPPPTVPEVMAILNSTTAPDGLDAMRRIKTVIGNDLASLRQSILTHVTAPTGASSIDSLSKSIRPLIERNPDGSAAGINYKAQRIARTEGVRIAEAGLQATIEADRDLFGTIEFFNAHTPDSRDDHIFHEGVYHKTGGGWVRGDGNPLPIIPLGPNCLCYTIPGLEADLTAGLPDANLGTYADAKKRFEAERDAAAAAADNRRNPP